MKKFYAMLLGAAIALVPAMAQQVPVQVAPLQKTAESRHALKVAKSVDSEKPMNMAKKMNETKAQKFAKKNKIAKAAPQSIIGNSYVVLYDDGYDDCNLFTTVVEGDNGTVVLKGLLEGIDISGTYDASTGKLTIPGSVVVGTNATYGAITLYASSGSSYYRNTPITGTVTETGITFDYGFMGGVSYNGGVGALYSVDSPEAFKPNGTFTASTVAYDTTPSKTYSAPILVTKTADDEITVVGINCALNGLMFTNGKDFGVNFNNVFTLDEAGMIATCPFEAFDNYGSYGDFKYGGLVDGYLDTSTFNITTTDNSSTLVCAGQSFYGYLNGRNYSGQTVESATMTIDFNVFAAESEEPSDPNEGWEDLGNATFMDGWVLTAFGIDQFDKANWYEVPLQQNIENRNLYRLVDPYHQADFPALQANESKKVGYIVFDVTDPDHVVVNLDQVEAGFANSSLGISKFYCYNLLTAYSLIFEEDPSVVIEVFEDDLAYTTYKDGVITLSYYDDPEYGRQYDANFGDQDDPTGGYSWIDADKNSVDMSAMIIFPGASAPEEPGDEEPATYSASVDGTYIQNWEGSDNPYDYTLDYSITYNADKTLTINGKFNWKDGKPVGAQDGIFLEIASAGWNTVGVEGGAQQGQDYTTTGKTFNAGDQITVHFQTAVALGDVVEDVPYVVGSVNGDITGNMTAQLDMNQGYEDEPDLNEADTWEVTASYDADTNKLTIYNYAGLNPAVFTVDAEAGTVKAEGQQLSGSEEVEGVVFDYYYGDFETQNYGMNGTIVNLSADKCKLRIDPWGEMYDIAIWGSFFNTLYYNTEIILDFSIEGLAFEPTVEITGVEAKANEEKEKIELQINYATANLPTGATVTAVITCAYDAEDFSGERDGDGIVEQALTESPATVLTNSAIDVYHDFTVVLLVKNAEGELIASDIYKTGQIMVSGIAGIEAEGAAARYYNLQGVEVANPENGIFIKVEGNKAVKIIKK